MVDAIVSFFQTYVSKEFAVFIISMFPIVELRGAIPIGTALGVSPLLNYGIAIVGNMLPVPFILIFIKKVMELMGRTKTFKPIVSWLENKAMSKSDQIHKYGKWGLFAFVAIPLPGTGAWTGSLIAALLGFKPKEAFPWILLGVICAGCIMLFGSEFVKWIIGLF